MPSTTLAKEGPKYFFHSCIMSLTGDDGDMVHVTIVSKEHWAKNHTMQDEMPEDLLELLEGIGLYELQEGEFEFNLNDTPPRQSDLIKVRDLLEQNGFTENTEFSVWLESMLKRSA
jgi:hypothetical protein